MAERAHRVVDDVSHEFRTPLAVIKEFASIINDGLAGPVSGQEGEYLKIMSGAVVDLNHMVEDLLDSSKLCAGRLRVEHRSYTAETIFENGRAALARKASSRSIVIEEYVEEGLPMVFADEEKVRRVISNLMTNTIKFSPEGSTIVLSAISSDVPGEVRIGVTDRGPGLSLVMGRPAWPQPRPASRMSSCSTCGCQTWMGSRYSAGSGLRTARPRSRLYS